MRWTSYRKFRIDRVERESESSKSFYLIPVDGQPLCAFEPGQHLPLKLSVPGCAEPIFRFYTLSDSEHQQGYRLTIKREPARKPAMANGSAISCSNYFHDALKPGDVIEAKAPAGAFTLDLTKTHPIVLIAGGIGVTPLLSMINALARRQPNRAAWLFFAVRDGQDHVFRSHFRSLLQSMPNLRMCVLYSQPRVEDRQGADYDRAGRINVELLRQMLPILEMDYYICGPGDMMRSLTTGLRGVGVGNEKIHTESFGPSSKMFEAATAPQAAQSAPSTQSGSSSQSAPPAQSSAKQSAVTTVTFKKSGKIASWNDAAASLWHFAEQQGVEISSGCLCGDCATCMSLLLEGDVAYLHPISAAPDPGTCLPCSCKPKGSIILDA